MAATPEEKDFAIFGQNVRNHRLALEWSFRECAERIGISENTLARIQNGLACSRRTQEKIGKAFGARLDTLWSPALPVERTYFYFPAEEARWSFDDPEEASSWALNNEAGRGDPDGIQDEEERFRLGRAGLSGGFMRICRSHLTTGFHGCVFSDVFTATHVVLPPWAFGFCLCCLRGKFNVRIDGDAFVLSEGDAVTVVATAEFTLTPIAPVGPKDLPPRYFLSHINAGEPTRKTHQRVRTKAKKTNITQSV